MSLRLRRATAQTIAQHSEILRALRERDPTLGEAAALIYIAEGIGVSST